MMKMVIHVILIQNLLLVKSLKEKKKNILEEFLLLVGVDLY